MFSKRNRLRHAKGLSQHHMSKIEKGGTWAGLEIIGKLAVKLPIISTLYWRVHRKGAGGLNRDEGTPALKGAF